jgi:hypothetical protein
VTLPRVQPIIPTWRKEPFDDPEWLFEFKYDGFRGLCYIEQGRCRFVSRNGNVLSRFEALADQVGRDVDEAVIDGEVIAADETGRTQFYELLRVPRSACYVALTLTSLISWPFSSATILGCHCSENRANFSAMLTRSILSPVARSQNIIPHEPREMLPIADNSLKLRQAIGQGGRAGLQKSAMI